jgi:hypothetical protein
MFDWSIRFEDHLLARRIAAAAVDQLGPGDLAAVVFTSAFSNGQAYADDRAWDIAPSSLGPERVVAAVSGLAVASRSRPASVLTSASSS